MIKKDKIMHINVFNGDDGIKYIRYSDMEKMLKRIKEVHDKIEDDLKIEIKRLNNRITELEKGVSRKEEQITNLDDENFDLENEIERLNNIINKAIEYIEKRKNLNWYADGAFVYELLNILQGDDKDVSVKEL